MRGDPESSLARGSDHGHGQSSEDMKSILEGLLRKASPDELSTLRKLFIRDSGNAQWRAAFVEQIEEILKKTCR